MSRSQIAVAILFAAVTFPAISQDRRALITQKIDETRRHVLAGNTRPEATSQNDRGVVPGDFAMEHMQLQLKRSPDQEQAVQQFIDDLHYPQSPQFHKWLTAQEFGEKYGASQEDIQTVRGWIESHGFTVNTVYPSGMLIDFSGTADQVRAAFGTEIHYLEVDGRQHVANIGDPQIPEALSPVVAGVVSMHDFTPHAMKKSRADYTFTSSGTPTQAVTPGDLATIYNLSPLFNAKQPITGKGQTIAVIEDANLYSTADWNTFRTTFGLTQYGGTLTTVHPAPASGTTNCGSPGLGAGDDGEAILDAEWASAAAPGANIVVAGCSSTRSTWGGLIALQNLVNSTTPPQIVSVSYGNCEAENGASSNAAFNKVYQQAVGEGISVFVSAGDEGAASCDAGATSATHGIGVSSWASTPNNVAVGGTDFGDSYAGTNSTYWNSTNTATYSSAISYIPEIPWDDSCANGLLTSYFKFSEPYGTKGFCGSSTAKSDQLIGVVAGSGGPSGCATGTPSTSGVVGGSCKGYAKPSWQAGSGVPGDGVRDIPDVSLFAADGVWGHYYVFCWSDTRNGGAPCTGAPSGWAGAGGTSFSSPILAGIQALVNQNLGGKGQGNPNYVYYQLASNSGLAAKVFHSVTQGDIAVNCGGSVDCYGAAASAGTGRRGGGGGGSSSGNGVLSTSSTSYVPAFGTSTSGWNFATGLGSVDANALVTNWPH